MSTTTVIILTVLVLVAAIATYLYLRQRRSRQLKARFGPEYDRAVQETGDRSRAERALEKRAARIEKYHIRPLPAADRDAMSQEWRQTQARFVDDPSAAIRDADRLICDVMKRTGYPMADFDHRAEDLSVEHPHVVRHYRAAHEIALANEDGKASTEDLRQGMVHYRELFDELIEAQPAGRQ